MLAGQPLEEARRLEGLWLKPPRSLNTTEVCMPLTIKLATWREPHPYSFFCTVITSS